MLTSKSTFFYSEQLAKGIVEFSEVISIHDFKVDLVLICVFFNWNLEIDCILKEGIKTLSYSFGTTKEQIPLKVVLNADGYYDAIYKKNYINTAGICQSILLDVISPVFINRLLMLYLEMIQNVKNIRQSIKILNLDYGSKKIIPKNI